MSSQVHEVVFVVDVSSFTDQGFIASTRFKGKTVGIEFDDRNKGVGLSPEMAATLHVKTGSKVSIVLENEEKPQVSESVVRSVGDKPLISDEKTYYFVGRTGGGVIRIRKK